VNQLHKFTIEDIRSWRPCYDPKKHLSKDWAGTAFDLVMRTDIPWEDVLWVVCRKECIDERLLRRFAAWCAAEALFLTKFTDKRSWNAVEVSVRFSLGEVDDAARDAAGAAARAAARAAAWDAAGAAARAAAWDAARAAAWAAAWDAARAAAWDAAGAAARAAAGAAARAAARDAAWAAARAAARAAAWDAARAAAWDAQRGKLASMLRGESDFTLSDILNNYPLERT